MECPIEELLAGLTDETRAHFYSVLSAAMVKHWETGDTTALVLCSESVRVTLRLRSNPEYQRQVAAFDVWEANWRAEGCPSLPTVDIAEMFAKLRANKEAQS